MKVILFGASGMVGQGVLRECLLDARVESVLAVVRNPLGVQHPKLREVVHQDFADFSSLAADFEDADACFFCLGISSLGRREEEYRRVTYDYTLAAARALPDNPGLTFVYVSGAGTDSTERGRSMWARVKGRTENELRAMPFHAYMFRPGYIQSSRGGVSKTPAYRWMYAAISWLYPLLRRVIPHHVTTTESVARAMIAVAGQQGAGEPVLDSAEINRVARNGH
ncbi:NAD(P)H-binding protein [Streptomyces sp. NBC_01306]|uniref:NAD(P)H-binding protein n=1 Tax=Streptomyces sp. NBC_01306 TaxID=2903819 RepID=UPI00225893BA|nr:NAD(P)H-binding protein [Streptomyces sp. NBC_01306]MCX4725386.1 NAD(P)H-binding protein [Streptomyces sp. NBC_01306]